MDEAAMRKRLQRIRDKLRKEIEVAEQRGIRAEEIRPDLPGQGRGAARAAPVDRFAGEPGGQGARAAANRLRRLRGLDLPEVVDFAEARKTIGDDALYLDPLELHRVDDQRILRYDLTLPLLLTLRYEGQPLRIWTAGKAYRRCQTDATHLEAFHQAEVLCLDERGRLDPWRLTGQVLQSIDRALPGRAVKIVPTQYPMCSQAWDLEVEDDGQWSEVLAWGVFTDRIVSAPWRQSRTSHTAIGVGYGLERLAMLRYGIDDIRKIDVSQRSLMTRTGRDQPQPESARRALGLMLSDIRRLNGQVRSTNRSITITWQRSAQSRRGPDPEAEGHSTAAA